MKTVILALVVLLVVSQGEAWLQCYCGGLTPCFDSIESCSSHEVCAIIVSRDNHSYFRSCLDAYECSRLIQSPDKFGVCCRTDLCNDLQI